ncbi:MAG TPA: hypothetical protein VLB84_18370, partial [Bacteroidia bacterium]|nr:hypothetical protein [Bacteroidia bacterium]
LGGPVTGLAPAGATDFWAVSAYDYRHQDQDHAQWNTLAWRSLNEGRLWDLPWDAPPGDPPPNSAAFQDTQLAAASFADRETGFLFGWQRPTFGRDA